MLRRYCLSKAIFILFLVMGFATNRVAAEPWSFGVMGDTQWIGPDDGKNPNSVAVGLITQINQQFINFNENELTKDRLKFVIQVGDLVDAVNVSGSKPPLYNPKAMEERAKAAQALYDKGIGFYPLRGNHDDGQAAAQHFQTLYPQTQGKGRHVFGAVSFSSPMANLNGLSYAFDHKNARLVLLDQFTRTDNSCNTRALQNNCIIDQQDWVSAALAGKPAGGHAFVLSHKNLIGENHTDCLFGANPGVNENAQEKFIDSLANNGVRYLISGHDHIHQRSLVQAPNSSSHVEEIIAASASSKLYCPLGNNEMERYVKPPLKNIAIDLQFNNPPRETSLRQELNRIGYYIYTVDGPRVTVDYYSADSGATRDKKTGGYFLSVTPILAFSKRETFGYSLNGKEFLVGGQHETSYTVVEDSFGSTRARILAGNYSNTAGDGSGRILTQAVNTGWTEKPGNLKSDVLSLWGMASGLGEARTEQYVLSLSFSHAQLKRANLKRGAIALMAKDERGGWTRAVDGNFGSKTGVFVSRSYQAGDSLGTYGIYAGPTKGRYTAWAVIDHDGDFAVGSIPVRKGKEK